jgi:hypothetical protein
MARQATAGAEMGSETSTCADPLEIRIGELLACGDMKRAATEAIRGYGPALLRFLRGLLGSEAGADR